MKTDRNPLSLHNVRPGKQWDSLRTEPLSRAEIDVISSYRWPVGLGIAGGFNGVVPFDIDCSDDIAREVFAALAKVLPKPTVWRKGSKGGMTFFRTEDAELLAKGIKILLPTGKPLVEFLVTSIATIPPTMHPKIKRPYHWLYEDTLVNNEASNLPVIAMDHVGAVRTALSPWCPLPKVYTPQPIVVDSSKVSKDRYDACAKTCLENAVSAVSSLCAGRNFGVYRAAAMLGKFVRHGHLDKDQVISALMSAADANGYTSKPGINGRKKAYSSIKSGLEKARNDNLKQLADRPRRPPLWKQAQDALISQVMADAEAMPGYYR